MLNDLEENFFKHVADDSEHLEQIKQRGDNSEVGNRNIEASAQKEEKKPDGPKPGKLAE